LCTDSPQPYPQVRYGAAVDVSLPMAGDDTGILEVSKVSLAYALG
jgi:hypothetical protein